VRRGDIVLAALQGDYGKPRPMVIIQADIFNEHYPSVVVCPVSSALEDTPLLRITVEPSSQNGLKKLSQIMLDKPHTIRREKIGERIGTLETEHLTRLNRSLVVFLGLS
jgi:mRNA interferase MazF